MVVPLFLHHACLRGNNHNNYKHAEHLCHLMEGNTPQLEDAEGQDKHQLDAATIKVMHATYLRNGAMIRLCHYIHDSCMHGGGIIY